MLGTRGTVSGCDTSLFVVQVCSGYIVEATWVFNSFLVKYVAIFFVIMDVLYIAFGYFMLIPMEDIFMGKIGTK